MNEHLSLADHESARMGQGTALGRAHVAGFRRRRLAGEAAARRVALFSTRPVLTEADLAVPYLVTVPPALLGHAIDVDVLQLLDHRLERGRARTAVAS